MHPAEAHCLPRCPRRPVRRRAGFTLVELLVVLSIIILLSVAAVPAVRFIMGSRSIESAQNIVAAMVSRARNQAVADGGHRGVFFFVDPVNDRTTTAIVGSDEFNQYMGWTTRSPAPNFHIEAPANATNLPGGAQGHAYFGPGNQPNTVSLVISLTGHNPQDRFRPPTNDRYLGVDRMMTRGYTCIYPNGPLRSATSNPPTRTTADGFWSPSGGLEMLSDSDFQVLPPGVGAQLINSNPMGIANFDRYLRIGCIMFDRRGQFDSVPWAVGMGSTLGKALHLAADLDLTSTNGLQPLVSQFGIVLYDRQMFLAQTSSAGANSNFTEGDWIFSTGFTYPGYTAPGGGFFQNGFGPRFPASANDEMANNTSGPPSEEQWLDQNALPLLIDRYDGTLIKGE